MKRWAIFVSGSGTNLQNVLELERSGLQASQVVAVHSDRLCLAVERAKKFDKAVLLKSPKDGDYELKLLSFLDEHRVNRIFLLGFMRILSKSFLENWAKPVINLHPSLLPKYRGLHAIRRAFENGDEEIGVSLHEVVEDLDAGPILRQLKLKSMSGESLEELTDRIHQLEYQIVREYLLDLEKID